MLLPITLTFAAACALLNMWLAIRCARFRVKDKILHGDAGNGLLAKRMRAHANFVEYTPIVLILFALVEMARARRWDCGSARWSMWWRGWSMHSAWMRTSPLYGARAARC